MKTWFEFGTKKPARFVAGAKDDCGIQQYIDTHTGIVYAGSPDSISPIFTRKGELEMVSDWYLRFAIHYSDLPKLFAKISLRDVEWPSDKNKRHCVITSLVEYELCKAENNLDNNVGTKINGDFFLDGKKYDVTISGCQPTLLVHLTFPVDTNPYDLAAAFGESYLKFLCSGAVI